MKEYMLDTHNAPENTWLVIHIDGDNFSKYTEKYDKPFDIRLMYFMRSVTANLVLSFDAIFAYSQFDEISILLDPDNNLLKRNLGKLISRAVSVATSTFTKQTNDNVMFAAHIYSFSNRKDLEAYFNWRIADCIKNCVNTYCHRKLVEEGHTPKKAAKRIANKGLKWRITFLQETFGINLADIPTWQLAGFNITWEHYEKEGYNPIEDKMIMAERRRINIEEGSEKIQEWFSHGD